MEWRKALKNPAKKKARDLRAALANLDQEVQETEKIVAELEEKIKADELAKATGDTNADPLTTKNALEEKQAVLRGMEHARKALKSVLPEAEAQERTEKKAELEKERQHVAAKRLEAQNQAMEYLAYFLHWAWQAGTLGTGGYGNLDHFNGIDVREVSKDPTFRATLSELRPQAGDNLNSRHWELIKEIKALES
jgi:chromosome segregation ATPase